MFYPASQVLGCALQGRQEPSHATGSCADDSLNDTSSPRLWSYKEL